MREVIYKGATRPAMVWGVPLPAFIALACVAFLACLWGVHLIGAWILAILLPAVGPIALWMRAVTKRDDQRLHQHLLLARLRARRGRARIWGPARCYAPIRYRGTRDAWRG